MVTSLSTYFHRVGYTGNASVSLETLQTLHLHHTQAIAFENLNPFLGWPVPLDTASLQEKLVNSRRGGYCYEQNLFFKHVLETIGFRVTGLAARVVWNMTPDVVLPRTHMLMRVEARGESFIADVGFGSLTLTAPLRLQLETRSTRRTVPFAWCAKLRNSYWRLNSVMNGSSFTGSRYTSSCCRITKWRTTMFPAIRSRGL